VHRGGHNNNFYMGISRLSEAHPARRFDLKATTAKLLPYAQLQFTGAVYRYMDGWMDRYV